MSINIENVTKQYENGVMAIKGISLDLGDTGLVALVGRSGSGKSTLLNLLSASDNVSRGNISIDSQVYNTVSKLDILDCFSYIYQDYKLITNLTVYENIMLGYELSNSRLTKEEITSLVEELNLTNYLHQYVYLLSGGQQQRVAIARALVRCPKVIFADEPTGNLDSKNTDVVFHILKKLSTKYLILLVTHDENNIRNWADRIVKLHDGKVIEDTLLDNSLDKINVDINSLKSITKSQDTVYVNKKSIKHYDKFKVNKSKPKLSNISTITLASAFNNTRKAKRISMVAISIIVIGFIFFFSSVVFTTVGKSILSIMDSTGDYNVRYNHSERDKLNDLEEYMLKKHNITSANIYGGRFKQMEPTSADKIPLYFGFDYEGYFRNNLRGGETVITDNPAKLGIQMFAGKAPVAKNEIAISKYMYEYMITAKQFTYNYNYGPNQGKPTIFNFNNIDDIVGKQFFQGSYIITGIFEDNCRLPEKYKTISWDNVARGSLKSIDGNEYQQICSDLEGFFSEYPLSNYILASTLFEKELMNLAGWSGMKHCFSITETPTQNRQLFGYAPLNDFVISISNINTAGIASLSAGEVLINEYALRQLRYFVNSEIDVGSEIDLTYLKRKSNSTFVDIDQIIDRNIKFTIKGIHTGSTSQQASPSILMNEEDFTKYNKNTSKSSAKYANFNGLKYHQIDDIYNYAKKIAESKEPTDGSSFMFSGDDYADDAYIVIDVVRKYFALPLGIITIAIGIILISVYISDIIKDKANDILILRSLGAKQRDILKVLSIHNIIIFAIEMILGVLSGLLGIFIADTVIRILIEGNNTNLIFLGFDWPVVLVSIGLIAVLNVSALLINLAFYRDKNLRKAFQKTKE